MQCLRWGRKDQQGMLCGEMGCPGSRSSRCRGEGKRKCAELGNSKFRPAWMDYWKWSWEEWELARVQGLELSLDFVPRNWEAMDGCKEAWVKGVALETSLSQEMDFLFEQEWHMGSKSSNPEWYEKGFFLLKFAVCFPRIILCLAENPVILAGGEVMVHYRSVINILPEEASFDSAKLGHCPAYLALWSLSRWNIIPTKARIYSSYL